MKNKIVIFSILLNCCLFSNAQDFKVASFKENLTDLSAAVENVKDLNNIDAALIRFVVRDNRFEFEPNLGIIRKNYATGEVKLFVPEGTKTITIRHPQLGVIRDYRIPLAIKSKVTYDAEIVITNETFAQSLFGLPKTTDNLVDDEARIGDNQAVQNSSELAEITPFDNMSEASGVSAQRPLDNEIKASGETIAVQSLDSVFHSKQDSIKSKSVRPFYVLLGAGYNAIGATGISFHLGMSFNKLNLEAGYVLGMGKVEGIGIYANKNDARPQEGYDYSVNKIWARIGYLVYSQKKFNIMPQLGLSFTSIKGKAVSGGVSSASSDFEKSNPMSAFAALRLSYSISKSIQIHVTPQFDFLVSKDGVYDIIKEADSKLKTWGEGLGLNAGIIVSL